MIYIRDILAVLNLFCFYVYIKAGYLRWKHSDLKVRYVGRFIYK